MKFFIAFALVLSFVAAADGTDIIGQKCRDPVWEEKCKKAGGRCLGKDKKCFEIIPKWKPCGLKKYTRCGNNLVCFKPKGKENPARCITKMDSGEPCGQDPYWVCKSHLRCMKKKGAREGKCFVVKEKGQNCGGKFDKCAGTLTCLKPKGKPARCIQKMDVGGACGKDPYWICKSHLRCLKPKGKKSGICVKN